MWRLLILVSITPFILGGICANFFGLSIVCKKTQISRTVEQVIHHLLGVLGRDDIAVSFVKSPLWSHPSDGTLRIVAKHQTSKRAAHAAKALVSLGILLLHEKQPATVRWRLKVVRMGHILPIFLLLIVIFTFIAAKLPLMIALSVISGCFGLCTIMLWLSLPIEKEAAQIMISRVEKLRILPRLKEEEYLVSALRATPWVSLIPGALLKFMLRG